ncbi:hypothetical protein MAV_3159 [Mycobacterium avium 104]|uniref:Uncharacterized protein n=1 Tax=Mycobacterium avium (strain 104) TaxID=243243 RepID=A0A0H2ZR99_MYCA1|nr:hypothetical protein MAV_3159 [Mycobacterium avium 104]
MVGIWLISQTVGSDECKFRTRRTGGVRRVAVVPSVRFELTLYGF